MADEPLSLALKRGHMDCAELLVSYCAHTIARCGHSTTVALVLVFGGCYTCRIE